VTPARTASAAAALALAAIAAAWPQLAAGAGKLAISASPSLQPAFNRGAPDYATRCSSDEPVKLAVDAPAGTTVAVDGRPARGGRFSAPVDLAPGRAFAFAVDSAAGRRVYHARCLPSDFPRWTAHAPGTPRGRFYVVTPTVPAAVPGYAVVFDTHGAPLWWKRGAPAPFDAEILPNGHLAWTGWVFTHLSSAFYGEHGLGGATVRKFRTVGTPPNAHDFHVLPNGNALMLTYVPRKGVDLRRWGGPKDAQVLDGEIQEIDRKGELAWSWSTRDHVALAESDRWAHFILTSPVDVPDGSKAVDPVHLNSVADLGDRLVISLRHTDALYEIDKRTGAVLWKLGGTKTKQSLRILDDPDAPEEFGGQHDARASDDGRTITVYDNGRYRGRPGRAVRYRVSAAKRTARLVEQVTDQRVSKSICCGSARRLPGGGWAIAWGGTPFVTEVDSAHRTVFTLELAESTFTYRADPDPTGLLDRTALRRGMDAMAHRGA
jgi:arylsulfotransferase ASST